MIALDIDPTLSKALLTSPTLLNRFTSKYFKEFDANGNGQLEFSEIRRAGAALYSHLGMPEMSEDRLAQIFSSVDVNNDGVFSAVEFNEFFTRCLYMQLAEHEETFTPKTQNPTVDDMSLTPVTDIVINKSLSNALINSPNLLAHFAKKYWKEFDLNENGTLEFSEVKAAAASLFASLGLMSAYSEDVIAKMFSKADMGRNGALQFDEFQAFFQRCVDLQLAYSGAPPLPSESEPPRAKRPVRGHLHTAHISHENKAFPTYTQELFSCLMACMKADDAHRKADEANANLKPLAENIYNQFAGESEEMTKEQWSAFLSAFADSCLEFDAKINGSPGAKAKQRLEEYKSQKASRDEEAYNAIANEGKVGKSQILGALTIGKCTPVPPPTGQSMLAQKGVEMAKLWMHMGITSEV